MGGLPPAMATDFLVHTDVFDVQMGITFLTTYVFDVVVCLTS